MGYYSARHEPGGNQVSLGDSVATAERRRCGALDGKRGRWRRSTGNNDVLAAPGRAWRARGLAWAIVAPGGAQIWLLTC